MQSKDELDPATVADVISDKAKMILGAFRGEAEDRDHPDHRSTSDITSDDRTGLPNDTVGHHIKAHLIQYDLVEKIGHVEGDSLNPNLYRITDRGKQVLEELPGETQSAGGGLDDEAVEEIREELRDQEQTDKWLEERLDEIEEQLGEHEEIIEIVRGSLGDS